MDEYEKRQQEESKKLRRIYTVGTIPAGQRGVRTRFGAVVGNQVSEGLYVNVPFIESVIRVDVRVQKEEVAASAASKDLQSVESKIALNYHIDPTMVNSLYKNVGTEYRVRLIAPALQESVKASTADFTAEELITKREIVRDAIKQVIVSKLQPYGILIDELNIMDFDFSESFNKAIEAKVTAEQDALAAKNKLQQVQFEAEQAIAQAKGKAQAISVESEALRNNPQVLELRALEKWNGVLPTVTGGAVPFINLK
jgi:regulator of protease activity HflC (stomatin/prohibitin superfamily)